MSRYFVVSLQKLTWISQVYIAAANLCGLAWNALRQASLTVETIWPESGPYVPEVVVSVEFASIFQSWTTKAHPISGSSQRGPFKHEKFKMKINLIYKVHHLRSLLLSSKHLVSISPTYYKQLSSVKIPKAQKHTNDLTVLLHFWDLRK